MRRFPLVVLAICLLASATGPALAEGKQRGGGENVEGNDQPASKPQVGSFRIDTNAQTVTGTYLGFSYNASGIAGFTVNGTRLFDATTPGAPGARTTAVPSERGVTVKSAGFVFVTHDVPTAPSKLSADGIVTITFSPETRIVNLEENGWSFAAGSVSGRIRADDARVVSNTLTARGDVLIFLDTAHAGIDTYRAEVATAIGKKHVGAEATVSDGAVGVRQDFVSYGNVTMQTMRLEKGNFTLLVEGHGFEGRVLVLNIDGRVLGAQKAGDLDVRLDNVTVQPAENLSDALDPDNDGVQPEYYVVFDPGAESFQLIVSVPHYSVHTLSVLTNVQLPPPSVVIGVLAGVALLVPTAMALFRRR